MNKAIDMVRWIFLSLTIFVASIATFVVLWVRRREQAKSTLAHIPDVEPETPSSIDETTPEQEESSIIDDDIETPPTHTQSSYEILSISVLANPKQSFAGYELLQSLLSNNLRFGKYQIFHYFELDKPLFSLASATQPGTFDMDEMGGYRTAGLTLFMELSEDEHLEAIFEKMLQVANNIAKDLSGYLVDDQHQPLGDTRIHALRTRIRNHYRGQEVEYEHTD